MTGALTEETVRARVVDILAAYKGDPEIGHSLEDDLLAEVVSYVASRKPGGVVDESQAICRAIVPLLAAERDRWYA
jgi:hypothetical protein